MTQPTSLRCGRFTLDLTSPKVMGVVNVTPDSFSDGGRHADAEGAVAHAIRLIEDGADLLDIGGESTRPGSAPTPVEDELARVVPVVRALRDAGVPLSVDTRRPEVMRAVLAEGADLINDIEGFRAPDALRAVQDSDCGLCVMHMQGDPATMQLDPRYGDVVAEVLAFLGERLGALTAAGITADRILLDPGYGFGKAFDHNVALVRGTDALLSLGRPLLVGVSRKGMIGQLTGRPVERRDAGSIGAALALAARGARVLRVHDVAGTRDALRCWEALAG